MKKYIFILLCFFLNNFSFGKVITIDEAIGLSHRNNSTLRNAALDVNIADINIKRAYKAALPTVEYTGGYQVDEHDIYGIGTGDRDNKIFINSVELSQPLYVGGAVYYGKELAEKTSELTDYALGETIKSIDYSIVRQYLNVLKQEEALRVYEDSLEEIEKSYRKAKRSYEVGLIPEVEVLPIESRRVSTDVLIEQYKNAIELSKLNFKQTIGMDPNVSFETDKNELTKYDAFDININNDINLARENSYSVKIAETTSEISKANEKITESNLKPKVSATLTFSDSDPTLLDSINEINWNVGVGFTWKLFDFGSGKNEVEVSHLESEKAKISLESTKDDAEYEVRQNYINLINLTTSLSESEYLKEIEKKNFNYEQKRYDYGLIDVTDYLRAENSYRQAQLDAVNARIDYILGYQTYLYSLI